MTQITRIDGLFRDEVGENLFRRLITIYPDGQVGSQGHVFRAVLAGPDKRVAALIEAHGCRILAVDRPDASEGSSTRVHFRDGTRI